MTKSTAELLAEFAAKGGKVQKVAPDATCGMTARDWHRAARDELPTRAIDNERDEAIAERQHEIGAAFGTDGLNEFNAGLRKHGAKAMVGW